MVVINDVGWITLCWSIMAETSVSDPFIKKLVITRATPNIAKNIYGGS